MKKLLALTLIFFAGALAHGATGKSCRYKAAEIVVQDLNKNGNLWSPRQLKSGEVDIIVKGGKVWLDLADEEVYNCENYGESVCVDYKFQDPETNRVEHQVQIEVDKAGCILRGYQNYVGARPWR
jgi:hypothetical protein